MAYALDQAMSAAAQLALNPRSPAWVTSNNPLGLASLFFPAGGISGTTLTFTSFNGGSPINLTFGDGTGGTIKTLDQLNAALQVNNLTATLDTSGKLTISASNDYASSTLGSVSAGGATLRQCGLVLRPQRDIGVVQAAHRMYALI